MKYVKIIIVASENYRNVAQAGGRVVTCESDYESLYGTPPQHRRIKNACSTSIARLACSGART